MTGKVSTKVFHFVFSGGEHLTDRGYTWKVTIQYSGAEIEKIRQAYDNIMEVPIKILFVFFLNTPSIKMDSYNRDLLVDQFFIYLVLLD